MPEAVFRMFANLIDKYKFDLAIRDFIQSHAYEWWDTL